jgi:hypothetical protein
MRLCVLTVRFLTPIVLLLARRVPILLFYRSYVPCFVVPLTDREST